MGRYYPQTIRLVQFRANTLPLADVRARIILHTHSPAGGPAGWASARQLPEHHQNRRAEARPTGGAVLITGRFISKILYITCRLHPPSLLFRLSTVTGKSDARIRTSCAAGLDARAGGHRIPWATPVRGRAQGRRTAPCHPSPQALPPWRLRLQSIFPAMQTPAPKVRQPT